MVDGTGPLLRASFNFSNRHGPHVVLRLAFSCSYFGGYSGGLPGLTSTLIVDTSSVNFGYRGL